MPNKEFRNKIKRLLYTYRDLNTIDLLEILLIDILVYRVRLKKDLKLYNTNSI